jgi:transposase IS116/IS110/IS902 family protein
MLRENRRRSLRSRRGQPSRERILPARLIFLSVPHALLPRICRYHQSLIGGAIGLPTIGDVGRFARSKQVARYLGLIPREPSSGCKQRMGATSKQGNRLLRTLLVEAAQPAIRFDPQFRKEYLHRCHRKHHAVTKVAAVRKLAVRLYWMLRTRHRLGVRMNESWPYRWLVEPVTPRMIPG